jgi:methyltransferase (TIGR00027 family)
MERTAPGVPGALLCRTRWIDDAIARALAERPRPVILLGAGLDTRAYRLPCLEQERVIELDLPAVQRSKRARLSRVLGAMPPRVGFVETDFNVEPLGDALVRGGVRADEPALFVWEGVTQYLLPEAVDSVLRLLAARPAGTELVFTYVLDEVVSRRFRPDRSEAFRRAATRSPEPWLFGIDPARLGDYVAERGLRVREDVGAEEHLAHLVRPRGRELAVSEMEQIAWVTK